MLPNCSNIWEAVYFFGCHCHPVEVLRSNDHHEFHSDYIDNQLYDSLWFYWVLIKLRRQIELSTILFSILIVDYVIFDKMKIKSN